MLTTITIDLPEGVSEEMFDNIIRPIAKALAESLKSELDGLHMLVNQANKRADQNREGLEQVSEARLRREKENYDLHEMLKTERKQYETTVTKLNDDVTSWTALANMQAEELRELHELEQSVTDPARKRGEIIEELTARATKAEEKLLKIMDILD